MRPQEPAPARLQDGFFLALAGIKRADYLELAYLWDRLGLSQALLAKMDEGYAFQAMRLKSRDLRGSKDWFALIAKLLGAGTG